MDASDLSAGAGQRRHGDESRFIWNGRRGDCGCQRAGETDYGKGRLCGARYGRALGGKRKGHSGRDSKIECESKRYSGRCGIRTRLRRLFCGRKRPPSGKRHYFDRHAREGLCGALECGRHLRNASADDHADHLGGANAVHRRLAPGRETGGAPAREVGAFLQGLHPLLPHRRGLSRADGCFRCQHHQPQHD